MTPDACALRGTPAAQRSRLYWLMAGLLVAPTELETRAALRELALQTDHDAEATPALRELAAALDSVAPAALAVEHTRLFGGLSPSYGPSPPTESAQRGGGVDTTLAVTGAYREAGYADIDAALPDDHLAVELKFMALLALREHEAAESGDRGDVREARALQRRFLDTHLGAWLPDYARLIERESRAPAWSMAMRVLDRAVVRDRAFLADAYA